MSEKLKRVIDALDELLKKEQIIIEATSGEYLLIRDQESGEEMLLDDLGYPF